MKSVIIRSKDFLKRTRQDIQKNPYLFVVYLILRLLVVAVFIAQVLNGDYWNALLCVLTLLLMSIPSFVERRIKIDVPDTLEIIILLFIFSTEIMGEIREYYVNVTGWDTMLHTISGFICAAIGFALIDILNRSRRFSLQMSPVFVALVAFCFSMTIGVIWEFFEFGMDVLFQTDMQKDTIVQTISSVSLHPDGRNIPVIISDITKTVIYGVQGGLPSEVTVNGYLDIGILDTMKDLFVNFIGALLFSVIGFFYIKYRGEGLRSRFVRRFILTKMDETSSADVERLTSSASKSKNEARSKAPDR